MEQAIIDSGLSYAIIRTTVIFGAADILINNIAWLLRHFPVFPIFGSGEYCLQPIYVEDRADLVINAGQQEGNLVLDASGPHIFTFNELVRLIASKLHPLLLIIHANPALAISPATSIYPLW